MHSNSGDQEKSVSKTLLTSLETTSEKVFIKNFLKNLSFCKILSKKKHQKSPLVTFILATRAKELIYLDQEIKKARKGIEELDQHK